MSRVRVDPNAPDIKFNTPTLDPIEFRLEQKYGLPDGLLRSIRLQGEKTNNNIISPKNAVGIYQLTPPIVNRYKNPGDSPTNPEQAAGIAARYMADQMRIYKKKVDTAGVPERLLGAMVAEYNGGPTQANAYIKTGRALAQETNAYLGRILPKMGTFFEYNPNKSIAPKLREADLFMAGGTAPTVNQSTPPQVASFGESNTQSAFNDSFGDSFNDSFDTSFDELDISTDEQLKQRKRNSIKFDVAQAVESVLAEMQA